MTFKLTAKQEDANKLLGSDATHILLTGGSRSGKTFVEVRACFVRAMKAPDSSHVVWRSKLNHARLSLWRQTIPSVLKLCFPTLQYKSNETDLTIKLSNNSELILGGLDNKDRVDKILGQEHSTMVFNEISQIPYPIVETALTRLAQNSGLKLRAYYDQNPTGRSHWSYQLWKLGLKPGTKELLSNPGNYRMLKMNPEDNREHLPREYFDILDSMSSIHRKRFKEGEWVSEIPGALWTMEQLDGTRLDEFDYPIMQRIVVAVDPPTTSGDNADECGIIVAGLGMDGRGYVLADKSVKGYSPEKWARVVINAYLKYSADRVVAEVNNGGDMVETVIRQVLPNVSYKKVHASRGKVTRAEPVSALYEKEKISHCGFYSELEAQMLEFTQDFSRSTSGYSPDRVDALVWAFTDLMIGPQLGSLTELRI